MSKKEVNSSELKESSAKTLDATSRDMMEDAAVGYYGNFGQGNQPTFAEQAPHLAEQSKQNKA